MTKPLSAEDRWRGGRIPLRWHYTYKDLARLYCVSLSTVKHWCSRHEVDGKIQPAKLDPSDLRSVMALYLSRRSAY